MINTVGTPRAVSLFISDKNSERTARKAGEHVRKSRGAGGFFSRALFSVLGIVIEYLTTVIYMSIVLSALYIINYIVFDTYMSTI